MNRIVNEIKDNKNMFRPISKLNNVNYLLLLENKKDLYSSKEINKQFIYWNRKYGNIVNIDDDDTDKNNINMIAKQVKSDLNKIEPDDNKIINSLVVLLYKKPSSRKKKLLWYMYGEQLFRNLCNNINGTPICLQCGKRTDEPLIRGKCFKCRKKEMSEMGYKLIQCKDCGRDVKMLPTSRTTRCDSCKEAARRLQNRVNQQKKRKCQQVRENTKVNSSPVVMGELTTFMQPQI